MKTITKIATSFIISFLFFNCSSDDAEPSVKIPTINYEETNIDVYYYMGSSRTPIINWNGDEGSFELIESYADGIPELTLNTTTGEISWTRFLGLGIWNFDIEATNSGGTTTIEMTLDNTLEGEFIGTYNTSHYFKVVFNKDHTVVINSDNVDDPGIASGTWTIDNDNVITVNYTYESGVSYSLKGTLTNTSFEGNWYNGHDAIEGNLGGPFVVNYDT